MKKTITKDRKKLRKQLKSISVLRKACNHLKTCDKVNNLSAHSSVNKTWGFYTNVLGFINDDYFSVTFMYHLKIDSIGVIRITENTDCIDEIKNILSDYSHLIRLK